MDDWRRETAAGLGRAVAAGRIDPRELAEAFLDAIAAHPDSARVYARTTPERARAGAAAAHARRAEGRPAGPLDGVPVSWKDNIDSAGVATEAGTRLLAGRVPARDAAVLANGSAAGLVCLGKTHLSELAFSGLGLNPMTATAPNALDPGLAPGGSSAGAAASVGLGLAAAGIGSDTGGSVRIPAAWNGLAGLKTTVGRLSGTGVVPLAASLDTVGPLARTVEDAALLLAALAGEPAALPEMPAAGAIRLRVPGTVVLEDCDEAIAAAFEAALGRLGRAGVAVARDPEPAFAEAVETAARHSPLVTAEAWATWGVAIEASPGAMWPPIEARFRIGAAIAPEADRAARRAFAAIGAGLAARIEAEGPLAMPTTPNPPPPVARLLAEPDFYTRENLRALRNTRLANLLGLASITLPLPAPFAGLMLVEAPGREARLLATARRIEAVLAG